MNEHPVVTLVRSKIADPAQPFTIIAEFEACAGRGDEVAAAIERTRVVPHTRAEAGCVSYDVNRDADATDRFVACECWRDLGALEQHLAAPHFAAVGAALAGLLGGAPTVRVLLPTR